MFGYEYERLSSWISMLRTGMNSLGIALMIYEKGKLKKVLMVRNNAHLFFRDGSSK
jgi:hypothetical protein